MEAALRTLYAALMVLSASAAVCGNLFILTVLLLNKELQSDTLCLTLSFSLSDLATGLSVIPFGAYNSLSWPAVYPSQGVFCQGSGFILLLLQASSLQSLTWATVDRFSALCFALSYRSMWTSRRSWVLLVLVWFFCLLNATLPLLGFGSYAYSKSRFLCCVEFTPENRSFVVLWVVVSVAGPVLTICSLYAYMVHIARKQARKGTFVCNELHCFHVPANTYLRSSAVMAATSACLLVCWLPFISVCLYETFSGQQSPEAAAALSTWLALTSAAINPWIICMTQSRYRSAVHQRLSRFYQSCSGMVPRLHRSAPTSATETAPSPTPGPQ
ncbi:PREDICTED: histamine H2 receptor-like isoform X1 [Cyprinodon variegatus]|uniref:Histamine H2 receptor-like n=1 Tax=Cyprinodon variegatus TaxID=28743 RepID=A0A3Q2CS44_CYPVA|nr:PREDICTED: histamine H2 receptor-like isoform X1 [Cyprinodon variegatus]